MARKMTQAVLSSLRSIHIYHIRNGFIIYTEAEPDYEETIYLKDMDEVINHLQNSYGGTTKNVTAPDLSND
jgi:hypothetical protein